MIYHTISYFLRRDNKGKIRIATLNLCEDNNIYFITGETGLFEGKRVERPVITIEEGKGKRTPLEQAKLQYNHEIELYLNKGYKNISELGIDEDIFAIDAFLDEIPKEYVSAIDECVPRMNTDQNGAHKPMLAKSYKDIPEKQRDKIFAKRYYASRKLDGVRCSIRLNEEGKLVTSSRGGKDYDLPATYILQDKYLINLFETYPNLILDGEIYIHGRPLSYISGLCRKKELEEAHKELEFHCYDIVDESQTFEQRFSFLTFIRPFVIDSNKLFIEDHYEVGGGFDNIMKLHDRFVAEGYEGLVLRDPDQKYKCGARDTRMIKVKTFEDDEFLITGLSEGLRDEDLCFTMETKEGYPFLAKPMGDRKLKAWYKNHIDELIGKMGTVKYFHYTSTDHPVPNLPVFKCVRDIKDIDL